MKNVFYVFLFIICNVTLLAQRPNTDSLYKKGTLGVEYRLKAAIDLNFGFVRGNNLYDISNGIGASYFVKNRWAVAFGVHHQFSSSNFGLKPTQHYYYIDLAMRYHIRNWYFGVGILNGNAPANYFAIYYEPRQIVIANLQAALHVRMSSHKKFWKDCFFVFNQTLGKPLYIQEKPDNLEEWSSLSFGGHIGLHYLIPRKK